MNPKAQTSLSTSGLSQSSAALVPDALPESETTAKISARKLVVNIPLPVHNVWGLGLLGNSAANMRLGVESGMGMQTQTGGH